MIDLGSGGRGGDFDLNLAPIIDCFTVLITFLLASASFLAIGILSTNPAIPSPATPGGTPPSINLEVELGPASEITMKVSGKETREKKFPAVKGSWDLGGLQSEVTEVRKKWPDTQSLVLSAGNEIEYEHLVRVMEALKTKIPAVFLGGF
jgi:biopolymer transport protein ExbD